MLKRKLFEREITVNELQIKLFPGLQYKQCLQGGSPILKKYRYVPPVFLTDSFLKKTYAKVPRWP